MGGYVYLDARMRDRMRYCNRKRIGLLEASNHNYFLWSNFFRDCNVLIPVAVRAVHLFLFVWHVVWMRCLYLISF